MGPIFSRNNQYIKNILKLTSKRNILEAGLFLVEGKNLINEAINAEIIENLLITSDELYDDFPGEKTLVGKDIIHKLSFNKSNEGAIAVCKYEPISVNLELVNRIVILENVNNPGNLGTIIRTALAFGFDAVVTLGESVFAYNDKVIRASQGALFKIPVMQLKKFNNHLREFKCYKFVLSEDAIEVNKIDIEDKKVALVFGNEANGITDFLKNELKGIDVKINIKNLDSLNLAISAGIAMEKFSK